MGLLKWSEKNVKKLSVYDFGVLKTTVFLLGMIVGAYVATFVKQYVWYFAAVFAIGYGYLLYKVFK